MKKKNEDNEMLKDDEVLREIGMTDGPRIVGGLEMRPITALSMSWIRRMNIFTDDTLDELIRTAAFAYLHTEEKEKIRCVIWNRDQFYNAVDEWLDEHAPKHHSALEPFADAMAQAIELYSASESKAQHPSPGDALHSKNA
jgi:hypothetical protein